MKPPCFQCGYFKETALGPAARIGECHRHAPTAAVPRPASTLPERGMWPLVDANDSCGDFERTPQ